MSERSSFFALIGKASRYTLRRWPLFAAGGLVTIAAQALVVLAWHIPHGIVLASAIFTPIFTTLVYAFVSADANDEPIAIAAVWERILERSWAVIVIDFIVNEITLAGLLATLSSSPLDPIFGMLLFVLSATLVFADASATVDDDVTVWSVVPRAFLRSLATAWNRRTFARVLAIFTLEFLIFTLGLGLEGVLTTHHLADAAFWAQVPLGAIATPPLAALTVLVYRDATQAPARPCNG